MRVSHPVESANPFAVYWHIALFYTDDLDLDLVLDCFFDSVSPKRSRSKSKFARYDARLNCLPSLKKFPARLEGSKQLGSRPGVEAGCVGQLAGVFHS
jgi:hypothetical protein